MYGATKLSPAVPKQNDEIFRSKQHVSESRNVAKLSLGRARYRPKGQRDVQHNSSATFC